MDHGISIDILHGSVYQPSRDVRIRASKLTCYMDQFISPLVQYGSLHQYWIATWIIVFALNWFENQCISITLRVIAWSIFLFSVDFRLNPRVYAWIELEMCYYNVRLKWIQGFTLILYSDFPDHAGIIRHFKLYSYVNSAIKPEIHTEKKNIPGYYPQFTPCVLALKC